MATENSLVLTVVEDHEGSVGRMTAALSPQEVSLAIQEMSAMVDKRISTARRFPRSITKFLRDTTELLTIDVATAMTAEYSKPVAGKSVKGPSLRLAEVAAMGWGNIDVTVGEPVVGETAVTVKAAAWDLENNLRMEGMSSTPIVGRDGNRYAPHMVEQTVLATAAKARRNAILNVIPRAYINQLLAVARDVANQNRKPFDVVRTEMLAFFERMKVPADSVYKHLGINGFDDLTSDHMDELRPIATAIKDGEAKPEEYFDLPSTSKAKEMKAKVEERRAASKVTVPPAGGVPEDPDKEAPATAPAPLHEGQTLFLKTVERYEAAGGDVKEWLSGHQYPYAGVDAVLKTATKPGLSKLNNQLSKACDKLEEAAQTAAQAAFSGGPDPRTSIRN